MVAERERSGGSDPDDANDASLRVTRSDAKLRERGGDDLRINRLMNESRLGLMIEIASKRLAICYGHLTMARISVAGGSRGVHIETTQILLTRVAHPDEGGVLL